MKLTAKTKLGLLLVLAAFIGSCQNDSLFSPEIQDINITRSSVVNEDTVDLISGRDTYYWVEDTKIPLHTIEGKYFVMYDDSSIEAVETALQQGTVTLHETLGFFNEGQTYSGYGLNTSRSERLKAITIQGDPGIETTLLSNVYYWAPYYRMDNGNEVRVANRFDVKIKSEKDFELLRGLAEKNGAEIVGKDEYLERWYKLECTDKSRLNALEMANLFQECGLFELACPDAIGVGQLDNINEPMYQSGDLWHLGNNLTVSFININYIESRKLISKGSSDVIIAIIDSGVKVNHRDFDETMSSGWDATTQTAPNKVSNIHGTTVAGFIGAVPNNYRDVAGVGYGCTILPISIYVDDEGTILESEGGIVKAIDYAVAHGAKVINCSWQFHHSKVCDAIKNALDKGCVVVFAAGNKHSNNIPHPACCDDRIIVVGAIDRNGKRADFCNYGPKLDVMAPGVEVYTLSPYERIPCVLASGTSFAAPQVAGLAGMIFSKHPDASAADVRYRIMKTARKVGSGYNDNYNSPSALGSWSNEYGYGLIDEYAALSPQIPYRYIIRVKNSSNYQPMIAVKIDILKADYSPANVTINNDFKVLYTGEELTAFCDLVPGNYVVNVYPENVGENEIDFEFKAQKGGEMSFEFVGNRTGEYEWTTPTYQPY